MCLRVCVCTCEILWTEKIIVLSAKCPGKVELLALFPLSLKAKVNSERRGEEFRKGRRQGMQPLFSQCILAQRQAKQCIEGIPRDAPKEFSPVKK